jgi:hypothetical protein
VQVTESGTEDALAGTALRGEVPQDFVDDEWVQSRHALLAGRSSWRPGYDRQTDEVRHLLDNQSSHPAFKASDSPPTIRIGVRVVCNPLPEMRPTSSAIRSSYLGFLSRQPLTDLVGELVTTGAGVKWEKWGGHGRSNHEAILTGADQQAAPIGWARLVLREPETPVGWREYPSALFLLHIERRPWEADGPLARPIPFLHWFNLFRKALEFPSAFASFLVKDLELDIPAKDPAILPGFEDYIIPKHDVLIGTVGIWLNAPQAMTDLVDISGFKQLPGSSASAQFGVYAVTRPGGADAAGMAIDWMRQMSDYTLHLDDYDSSLSALGNDNEDGQP